MNQFIEIPANKISLSKRKLVYGVGVNDADYKVEIVKNGRRMQCPYYLRWMNMLRRCYYSKYHEKYPTYKGCSVCKEWLTFSVFEAWMLKQDWKGMALDKDILNQGNKIYAPEYCRFISQALNSLLTASGAARGDLPLGVTWHKHLKKYRARINIDGNEKHLGYFNTIEEAKAVYDKAKYAEINRHAMMQTDPEIRNGLLNWVID